MRFAYVTRQDFVFLSETSNGVTVYPSEGKLICMKLCWNDNRLVNTKVLGENSVLLILN